MQAPISTAYSMACAKSRAWGPVPLVNRTGRMRDSGATPEKRSTSLQATGRDSGGVRTGNLVAAGGSRVVGEVPLDVRA